METKGNQAVVSKGRKGVENNGTTDVVANVGKVAATIEAINEKAAVEAAADIKEGKEMEINNDEEKVRRNIKRFLY